MCNQYTSDGIPTGTVETRALVGYARVRHTSATVASGTTYTDQTAGGGATAILSGGGAGCTFTSARFLPLSAVPEPPPGGYSFPHGLFDFTSGGCTPGATITVTITYATALNPNTIYWKYGPTAEGPDGQPGTGDDGQPHWYTIPAIVAGNSISFTITDGGRGDDDLAANGVIVDQGGPGVPASSSIPTLSEWARLAMGLLLAVFGVGALKRRQDQGARS